MDEIPPNAIVPAQLCQWHQHDLIVHKLRIPQSGPWASNMIIANAMLFSLTTLEDNFNFRVARFGADGYTAAMNGVLAEIGCLACYRDRNYNRVVRILRRGGLEYAAKLMKGEAKDPDFPLPVPPLRSKDDATEPT